VVVNHTQGDYSFLKSVYPTRAPLCYRSQQPQADAKWAPCTYCRVNTVLLESRRQSFTSPLASLQLHRNTI
jgi:hypothetical protein